MYLGNREKNRQRKQREREKREEKGENEKILMREREGKMNKGYKCNRMRGMTL